MVMYIDDGYLLGWYYCTEGCRYGDGTLKDAERIAKERCASYDIVQTVGKLNEAYDMAIEALEKQMLAESEQEC